MSQIAITKAKDTERLALPVFGELGKRFEAIQRRAFDLFEKRGRESGHELDDWLQAEHELLGWPVAELTEKDGVYEMEVALSGFAPRDVEVTATPNEVIVHAAADEQEKGTRENVLCAELDSGDVYRTFGLAQTINVDKLSANFEDGLLRIIAPKMDMRDIGCAGL